MEFAPDSKVGLFELVTIEDVLREYLQHEVDVVTPNGLKASIREAVLREAEVIYIG